MAGNTDPQRRPVYVDRVNQRLLADPIGAGAWPVVALSYSMLGEISANTLIGRTGSAGAAQELSAEDVITLLNAATSTQIAGARVASANITTPGVVQLNDGVASTSTTTAATPNAVKQAYDLAGAAMPKSGGVFSGNVEIGAGAQLIFEGATDNGFETRFVVTDPSADRDIGVPNASGTLALLNQAQTYTAAQSGAIVQGGIVTGTITLDFATSNNFALNLGGNCILGNPTNASSGQSGAITINQSSTNAWTVAYTSNWKFPDGVIPVIPTVSGARNVLVYYCESPTRIVARLITDVK